ncbi:MAG: substrate-binding domain-containing protein [Kiritimatiellia bacterium]
MKQRSVLLLISPAYPPRLQGIARFARTRGWHLMIEDRLARLPRGWRGDGALVTLRENEETVAYVRNLRRHRIPVVDLTFNRPDVRIPRVTGDHTALGRLAAEHFLDRHFRHAAWYSTIWTHVHELRYGGFAAAWPGERPFKWVLAERTAPAAFDDWRLFTRLLGQALRDAPKPLAVLTYDDADAARVLSACRTGNLSVPEEVAILGVGNDALVCENQAVPLSSVDHDLERGGYEGAALLERLMNGDPAPARPVCIPPKGIVTRQSTDVFATDDPVLRDVLRYIKDHLAEPFGAAQIANALNLPRTRLDRLFADRIGHAVGQEILRARLARAKLLLAESRLPIAEIARATGFCNAGYLSCVFKRNFGLTPRAWRKR